MSETPTPAPEQTPDPAPQGDPAPEPTPTPDPTPDPDAGNDDPRVKRANAQAAAERVKRRELEDKLAEQGATLQKLAAVFNPESTTDDPAQQLAAITGKAETLQTQVADLSAQLLVHELAADNGGNANALLDSHKFTTTLQKLDAAAETYRDDVAKAITDAVAANANLAGAGQVPSRGGAPGAGQGPASPGGVTQEQFDAMTLGQRNELFQTNPDTYRRLAASIR